MAQLIPQLLAFAPGVASQVIGSLGVLGKQVGATDKQIESLTNTATVATKAFGLLQSAFSVFISSNEQLNQQLLSSQGLLANNVSVFNQYGQEVTDLREKLESTRGVLKQTLKDLEKDTQQLVGVTTEDVNQAFSIVLRNIGDIQGQSKDDTLTAAKNITADIVAATGALGLGRDQIAQEARALLSGDTSNPDALLIQSLNLDKAVVAQKKASGEYIGFLRTQLASFREANALASESLTGIGSNITDFFQRITKVAGEDALEPIAAALGSFLDLLSQNEGEIQGGLNVAFTTAFELLQSIANVLRSTIQPFVPLLVNGFKNLGTAVIVVAKTLTVAFNGIALLVDTVAQAVSLSQEIVTIYFKNILNSVKELSAPLGGFFKPIIDALIQGNKDAEALIRSSPILTKILEGTFFDVTPENNKKQTVVPPVTIDNKALTKEADVFKATLTDLENARNGFNKINEEGRGNRATFDQATQSLVDQINKAKELGVITRDQAIADLDNVANSEFTKRDIRIKAFQEAQKLREQEKNSINEVIETEQAVNEALVARGRISSEAGAVNNQVAEIKKLEEQARITQEALNFKKSAGLDFGSEERELNKLNAQLDNAQAKLDGLRFAEELAKVDKQTRAAQQALELSAADSQLKVQQLVNKGIISQSEAQEELTKKTIEESKRRISNAQSELAALEKVNPVTLAEKQQLQDRRASLRVSIINDTKAALQAELQVRQQIIAQQQKLEELERNLANARAKQPFAAELRAKQQVVKQLELQQTLQAAINNLVSAQLDLQVSRANLGVSRAQEIVNLQKQAAEGSVEAQRQLAELGAVGRESQQAQRDLLEAQQRQIEASLQATLTKLQFEQTSLSLEQEKTKLALEQEKIALRISQLETKAAAAKLNADKIAVQNNQNLSSEEKAAQIESIDQQLEVNTEISSEQQKQIEFLNTKAEAQERINALQQDALDLQQQATKESAIADAQAKDRQFRLANESALEPQETPSAGQKTAEENKARGKQSAQEEEAPKPFLGVGKQTQLFDTAFGRPQKVENRIINGGISGGSDFTPRSINIPNVNRVPDAGAILNKQKDTSLLPALEKNNSTLQEVRDTIAQALAKPQTTTNVVNNFPNPGASRAARRLQGE